MLHITWDSPRVTPDSRTRLSRSLAALSITLRLLLRSQIGVPQPQRNKFLWFGLFRFRSPLLTESFHFLFLGVLRCFTSPRIASTDYTFICRRLPLRGRQVLPFGNPRVKACLRLTTAYRNLLRPSSPLGTKASTNCT